MVANCGGRESDLYFLNGAGARLKLPDSCVTAVSNEIDCTVTFHIPRSVQAILGWIVVLHDGRERQATRRQAELTQPLTVNVHATLTMG
jgi:hypothetical protein